jgi:hypothetical protein
MTLRVVFFLWISSFHISSAVRVKPHGSVATDEVAADEEVAPGGVAPDQAAPIDFKSALARAGMKFSHFPSITRHPTFESSPSMTWGSSPVNVREVLGSNRYLTPCHGCEDMIKRRIHELGELLPALGSDDLVVSTSMAPKLVGILVSPVREPIMKEIASALLGMLSASDAAVYLADALQIKNDGIQKAAAYALESFHSAAEIAMPQLGITLEHTHPDIRQIAAKAFQHFGSKGKAYALKLATMLEDKNLGVVRAAVYALLAISPDCKVAVPKLAEAVSKAVSSGRSSEQCCWERLPPKRSRKWVPKQGKRCLALRRP